MHLGKPVRESRKEKKLPQHQLVAKLEIDTPMYSKIDRGECQASSDQILKLAELPDTDMDELLTIWLAGQVYEIGKDKVINHHMDVPYKILEHQYGFDNGVQSENETNSGNKIIHGGNRRFILVEMEDYSESITTERVKRVIKGYGEDKKAVEGTGGCFDYYELGKPPFLENEMLNEEVSLGKIRKYVWFSETRLPYKKVNNKEEYLLGVSNSSAYYFYYFKDKLTTLDDSFLRTLKTEAEQYIIYADNCVLANEFMQKYHITFKKIPRNITRF